jgi:hypothetical protein
MLFDRYGLALLWATIILFVIHILRNWLSPGVRTLPGPFLAKLSNVYRLVDVSKGQNHTSLLRLHDTYGDNVRLGPNVVSIRNPKDVSRVYGIKGTYVKVRINNHHL